MPSILGVVTIGQTPRPDLIRAFADAAPHAEVRIAGALDGVSEAELAALTGPGEYPLLVRLASGATAEVPMALLVPRVVRAARDLAGSGATVVVVACAGGFPEIPCPVPVVIPGRVVPAVAGAISRTRRIGIVTPNRAQAPFAEKKWTDDGFDPVVAWASPTDEEALLRTADAFTGQDVDLVVLDCMGHDEASRSAMARRVGCPVIAAQALVARVAASLL